MKVSLFVTCLVDQLWPSVGVAAVEVLRRAGCEVRFDPRQTCCGQPAFNSGWQDFDFYLTLVANGYRGKLLDLPLVEYRIHFHDLYQHIHQLWPNNRAYSDLLQHSVGEVDKGYLPHRKEWHQ